MILERELEDQTINQQLTLFEIMELKDMNSEDLKSLRSSNLKKIKNLKDGDRLRVWLEDSVETEGGFWWECTVKIHYKFKCLYQDGFNYKENNDYPSRAIEFINYQINFL